MKFTDKKSGANLTLRALNNTDYWYDQEGDLYSIDMYSGQADKINAAEALVSLQIDQNSNNGYCPICDCKCLKIKASENMSYLTPFDKWFK